MVGCECRWLTDCPGVTNPLTPFSLSLNDINYAYEVILLIFFISYSYLFRPPRRLTTESTTEYLAPGEARLRLRLLLQGVDGLFELLNAEPDGDLPPLSQVDRHGKDEEDEKLSSETKQHKVETFVGH